MAVSINTLSHQKYVLVKAAVEILSKKIASFMIFKLYTPHMISSNAYKNLVSRGKNEMIN